MATLSLGTIQCVRKQDITGKDEPQLKVDGRVIWTGKMAKGAKDNVAESVQFNGSVGIELEELDGKKAKKIGQTQYVNANGTPSSPLVFTTSGCHYTLAFSVS